MISISNEGRHRSKAFVAKRSASIRGRQELPADPPRVEQLISCAPQQWVRLNRKATVTRRLPAGAVRTYSIALRGAGRGDGFRPPEPCELCGRPVYDLKAVQGDASRLFTDMPWRAGCPTCKAIPVLIQNLEQTYSLAIAIA